jgi:hypothetical protein
MSPGSSGSAPVVEAAAELAAAEIAAKSPHQKRLKSYE